MKKLIFIMLLFVSCAAGAQSVWYSPPDTGLSSLGRIGVSRIVGGQPKLFWVSKASLLGGSGAATWGSINGTLSAQSDLNTALSGKSSTSHTHAFSTLTSIPTTISGYGITDAFTQTLADARYSVLAHTHTFASLTSKPTTLSGYGITDAASTSHTHAESDITNLTTDLAAKAPVSTTVTLATSQTLTNKTLTSPVINSPTGIVKGDVGLGNVDNTSNATERAATATLTNKTISYTNNTITIDSSNMPGWKAKVQAAGDSTVFDSTNFRIVGGVVRITAKADSLNAQLAGTPKIGSDTVATKAYARSVGGSGGTGDMTLAGNQTVTGLKTFTPSSGTTALLTTGDILPTTDNNGTLGTSGQAYYGAFINNAHLETTISSYFSATPGENFNFYDNGGTLMNRMYNNGHFINQYGGTYTDHASTAFQVNSTTGGLRPPRMTSVQRTAITTSAATNGVIVFDTDSSALFLYNGSTWAKMAASNGAGTVTSVGISMPSDFSVASSPVTTSGVIAVTRTTQSANTVMAGPTSGSAAAPTFRAIGTTDLPTINYDLLAFQALGSVIKGQTVGTTLASTTSTQVLGDGQAIFVATYLPVATTLTGIKFWQAVQGSYTADNNNYIALYSYSGGTLTQVAISANDGNLWKGTANSMQTVPFASTYVAPAGVYFVGFLYNQSAVTTAPTIGTNGSFTNAAVSSGDYANSAKTVSVLNAQTALTTPIASSSLITTNAKYWIGLY